MRPLIYSCLMLFVSAFYVLERIIEDSKPRIYHYPGSAGSYFYSGFLENHFTGIHNTARVFYNSDYDPLRFGFYDYIDSITKCRDSEHVFSTKYYDFSIQKHFHCAGRPFKSYLCKGDNQFGKSVDYWLGVDEEKKCFIAEYMMLVSYETAE